MLNNSSNNIINGIAFHSKQIDGGEESVLLYTKKYEIMPQSQPQPFLLSLSTEGSEVGRCVKLDKPDYFACVIVDQLSDENQVLCVVTPTSDKINTKIIDSVCQFHQINRTELPSDARILLFYSTDSILDGYNLFKKLLQNENVCCERP